MHRSRIGQDAQKPGLGRDINKAKFRAQHVKRLAEIRRRAPGMGTLDNSAPYTVHLMHLKTRPKKRAMLAERLAQVERANMHLLRKMARIFTSPSCFLLLEGRCRADGASGPVRASMNALQRKRELERIVVENRHLVKLLEAVSPSYEADQWRKDRVANKKLMQRLRVVHDKRQKLSPERFSRRGVRSLRKQVERTRGEALEPGRARIPQALGASRGSCRSRLNSEGVGGTPGRNRKVSSRVASLANRSAACVGAGRAESRETSPNQTRLRKLLKSGFPRENEYTKAIEPHGSVTSTLRQPTTEEELPVSVSPTTAGLGGNKIQERCYKFIGDVLEKSIDRVTARASTRKEGEKESLREIGGKERERSNCSSCKCDELKGEQNAPPGGVPLMLWQQTTEEELPVSVSPTTAGPEGKEVQERCTEFIGDVLEKSIDRVTARAVTRKEGEKESLRELGGRERERSNCSSYKSDELKGEQNASPEGVTLTFRQQTNEKELPVSVSQTTVGPGGNEVQERCNKFIGDVLEKSIDRVTARAATRKEGEKEGLSKLGGKKDKDRTAAPTNVTRENARRPDTRTKYVATWAQSRLIER